MDIQTEKLLVIEQILQIRDESVINKLLQWLANVHDGSKADTPPLPPLSDAELMSRMQQAIQDVENKDTVSQEEAMRMMQEWRRA